MHWSLLQQYISYNIIFSSAFIYFPPLVNDRNSVISMDAQLVALPGCITAVAPWCHPDVDQCNQTVWRWPPFSLLYHSGAAAHNQSPTNAADLTLCFIAFYKKTFLFFSFPVTNDALFDLAGVCRGIKQQGEQRVQNQQCNRALYDIVKGRFPVLSVSAHTF